MSWKFNPPPGWPAPPDDSWVPPPGWTPDPSWPPAPTGWEFWVPSGQAPSGQAPSPAPPGGGLPPVQPWPAQAPFQVQPGAQPGSQQQPPAGEPPTSQAPGYPYAAMPPPARPAGGSRRGQPWLIAGIIGAVLLVMCTGGTVAVAVNWDRLAGGDDPPGPPIPSPGPGGSWAECRQDPNACNSGEVTPGGELVWAAGYADSWNANSVRGYSQTTRQIMTGVAPGTGVFLPDGTWQWNLDLLAGEPELVAEDPHTWVYRIRPEATWDDGTPISADDFAFVWRQSSGDSALCDGCTPISTAGYDQIDRVEGSDGGQTVTVTLESGQTYPDWRTLFGFLYPAHIAEDAGFDLSDPTEVAAAAEWFDDTVPNWSGGPWRVAEGDLSQEVVLEPNPGWYGATQPSLERIVFRIIEDPQAQVQALETGEVDGVGPQVDPDSPASPQDGTLSYVGPSYLWEHIDFNLERPGMDDGELRRAIFTAIDVQQIVETVYARAPDTRPRLNHLFPETSPYFEDHLSATGQGSGDPTTALAILEQAGYELVDGELTRDGEQVGPLVVTHSEGHQRRTAVAEIVSRQLSEIGIELEIRPGPLFELLEQREYDLIIFGWSGDPTFSTSGMQYWHSDSTSNFGGYQNQEVDSLVSEASVTLDLARSADLLNQANQIVANEAYVLPITEVAEQHLVSDQYRNIRPNPAGTIFYNSHEWGQTSG